MESPSKIQLHLRRIAVINAILFFFLRYALPAGYRPLVNNTMWLGHSRPGHMYPSFRRHVSKNIME
jgi:hypothetical protein